MWWSRWRGGAPPKGAAMKSHKNVFSVLECFACVCCVCFWKVVVVVGVGVGVGVVVCFAVVVVVLLR